MHSQEVSRAWRVVHSKGSVALQHLTVLRAQTYWSDPTLAGECHPLQRRTDGWMGLDAESGFILTVRERQSVSN